MEKRPPKPGQTVGQKLVSEGAGLGGSWSRRELVSEEVGLGGSWSRRTSRRKLVSEEGLQVADMRSFDGPSAHGPHDSILEHASI